ncbi:MAG TPA: hypothetical protein VD766_04895 [Solirubrobacterales bacterium]|nr:hypothetical protein [Solirubrobacterales bacterium]
MTATRPRLSSRSACTLSALLVVCFGLIGASSAQAAGTVNGVIAYTAGDIFTVSFDGTNKTRITNTELIETEPEYSPDGTRIAFVGFPAMKPDELYVISADGQGQTKLTSAGGQISLPTWTSDGSRILFVTDRDDDSNGDEIYSIAPDGGGETLLASDARRQDVGTSLSTAANKIAYSNTDGEITVMNLDGSGKQVLAPDPGFDTDPQLSPDASTIIFTSERGAGDEIGLFKMNADGTDVAELASPASSGSFSPDGSKILFQGAAGSSSAAKVMNADGSGAVQVSAKRRFAFPEEFSPDSTRVGLSELLARNGEDPIFSLQTSPANAAKPRRLTKGKESAEYGDWQPLAAPAPTPPLIVKAKLGKPREGAPQAKVTCSNECGVLLSAKGTFEGVKFSSKTEVFTVGRVTAVLQALGDRTLDRLAGKSGVIRVGVRATDEFGQHARTTLRVKF